MRYYQNLHVHSTFCDGVDTPEEMIRYAQALDFDSLGFSGHCYMPYSPYQKITPESSEAYKREITSLKEKYRGILPIYLGLEVDMYAGVDMTGYDYLIGTVHYLKKGDTYMGFDRAPQVVRDAIDTHYDGDGMTFARAYYEAMAELPKYGKFDIIGHFDLIAKNLEVMPYFDETSSAYLSLAKETIAALKGKIPLFEVNTGAMARGYRSIPYPIPELVKEFKRQGFGAIIRSDCHEGRYLVHGFEQARELLLSCGFTERYVLTENGFHAVEL